MVFIVFDFTVTILGGVHEEVLMVELSLVILLSSVWLSLAHTELIVTGMPLCNLLLVY